MSDLDPVDVGDESFAGLGNAAALNAPRKVLRFMA
jgi:hypothetical protein